MRRSQGLRTMLSDQDHLTDAVANTGWLKNMLYHDYAVVVVERPGTGAPFGRMDHSVEVGARQADCDRRLADKGGRR